MGKSSPAPPPDYTAEKRQIREDTEAKYATEAKDYNDAIAGLSTRLSDLESSLNKASSFSSNLGLANMYDSDFTDASGQSVTGGNRYNYATSLYSGLDDSFDSILDDYEALTKPTFESSVQSEYGAVGITDIPTLDKFSSTKFDRLQGEYDDLYGNLTGMQGDYQKEAKRVQDFRKGLLADVNDLTRGAANYTIADLNSITGAESGLGDLMSERDRFSSVLMDNLYPDGFTNFNTKAQALTDQLSGLRTDRANELQRISDFESGLYDLSDAQRELISGYDIRNKDEAQAVLDAIDERTREAGRFDSLLDFDFSQELRDLGLTRDEANQILVDRAAEEGRISKAQADALKASNMLTQDATDASIYSLAGLDALGDSIAQRQSDIQGFSSLLDFDFGDATTNLGTAAEALQGRRDARQAALDEILNAAQSNIGGIEGVADYDEAALREIASGLSEQNRDLSRFTGGRTGDIQAEVTAGLEQIDGRLEALRERRNELEATAQDIMQRINDASFYAVDDLTGLQSEFDTAQAEIDLYNAQQALDELATAESRLNSERQRLERDAENVAAREREGRDAILSVMGPGGVAEFQEFAQLDPIGAQAYARQLAQSEEEEEYLLGLIPSAFTQNVIRV